MRVVLREAPVAVNGAAAAERPAAGAVIRPAAGTAGNPREEVAAAGTRNVLIRTVQSFNPVLSISSLYSAAECTDTRE